MTDALAILSASALWVLSTIGLALAVASIRRIRNVLLICGLAIIAHVYSVASLGLYKSDAFVFVECAMIFSALISGAITRLALSSKRKKRRGKKRQGRGAKKDDDEDDFSILNPAHPLSPANPTSPINIAMH